MVAKLEIAKKNPIIFAVSNYQGQDMRLFAQNNAQMILIVRTLNVNLLHLG